MRGIALLAAAGVVAAGLSLAPVAVAVPAVTTATAAKAADFSAASAAKYKFKNCTAMNKVYAHGVGKSTAKDKTSGKPVTTFKHSTSLYKKIVKYRKGLDRDHDGIACERA
jgi:hypothetical protein